MARYYDLDKLSKLIEAKADTILEGKGAMLYVAKWLNLLPTADVAEVKHGEWEKTKVVNEEYGYVEVYYQHKDCKISPAELYKCPFEHCPRCGAKMDGGKTE